MALGQGGGLVDQLGIALVDPRKVLALDPVLLIGAGQGLAVFGHRALDHLDTADRRAGIAVALED